MKTLTLRTFIIEFYEHFLILALLSILIYFMGPYPGPVPVSIFLDWAELFPFMSIYLTYCILFYHLFFKRLLTHKRFKNSLLVLGFLIFGFLAFDTIYLNVLLALKYDDHQVVWFAYDSILRLIFFTAYAVNYSCIKGFSWMRIQKLQIEKESANASLRNLRSQIEPHFIFNSLNSVYALSIEEKAKKTSESIEELSGLFRYSLKDINMDKVPVQDELDFIEKYIHLNKIRVQENAETEINTTIFWDKKPAQIAPLLIITFIENAFKYGLSFKRASFIDIQISVEDGKFHLLVRNSIHQESIIRNGFGLKNTRTRLDMLYNGNFSLEENQYETIYEVILKLNLI